MPQFVSGSPACTATRKLPRERSRSQFQPKRTQDAERGTEFRVASFAERFVKALSIESGHTCNLAHPAGARHDADRVTDKRRVAGFQSGRDILGLQLRLSRYSAASNRVVLIIVLNPPARPPALVPA